MRQVHVHGAEFEHFLSALETTKIKTCFGDHNKATQMVELLLLSTKIREEILMQGN